VPTEGEAQAFSEEPAGGREPGEALVALAVALLVASAAGAVGTAWSFSRTR
jgi:hypothetical protein